MDDSWNGTALGGISGTNEPTATGAADIMPGGAGADTPVGPQVYTTAQTTSLKLHSNKPQKLTDRTAERDWSDEANEVHTVQELMLHCLKKTRHLITSQ